MKNIAGKEDGYTYADQLVKTSPITMEELQQLKISVGFTKEDHLWLRLAGEVLADQTAAIVTRWRSEIIASIPHLARHSRSPEGGKLPAYLAQSNLRFEQWILDTCLRDYDQHWLNYQHEIALRHTSEKKNKTDGVESTAFVPYRDIAAFTAVLIETIRPYLAAKGHPAAEVEAMHRAWGSQDRVKQVRSYLKSIFDEAIEQEFLVKDPTRTLKIPKNLRPKDKQILTWEQMGAIVASASRRDRLVLMLDMTDALRPSEPFALRWQSFDDANTLSLTETVYRRQIRPFGKTPKSLGKMHLPDGLAAELKLWKLECPDPSRKRLCSRTRMADSWTPPTIGTEY